MEKQTLPHRSSFKGYWYGGGTMEAAGGGGPINNQECLCNQFIILDNTERHPSIQGNGRVCLCLFSASIEFKASDFSSNYVSFLKATRISVSPFCLCLPFSVSPSYPIVFLYFQPIKQCLVQILNKYLWMSERKHYIRASINKVRWRKWITFNRDWGRQ